MLTKTTKIDVDNFLKEVSQISKKYGICFYGWDSGLNLSLAANGSGVITEDGEVQYDEEKGYYLQGRFKSLTERYPIELKNIED
jgi:hypothetical protein